jgi:hypothetical protein
LVVGYESTTFERATNERATKESRNMNAATKERSDKRAPREKSAATKERRDKRAPRQNSVRQINIVTRQDFEKAAVNVQMPFFSLLLCFKVASRSRQVLV